MFAGSETGARRGAVLYSLVAMCKLNEVDPFAYFRDVLGRISTHPASRIDELLPGEWKKTHPATLPASPTRLFTASA
jgi:transposase